MSQLKVLVSGASVAGPFAAYWLARAGAHVTVIERFPQLRPGGQSVDIRGPGVDVMKKVPGLEQKIRRKRSPFDGLAFVRQDGTEYGRILPTGDEKKQSLISEYEILRGDLAETLVELCSDNSNVKYVWGDQITAMQNDLSGVEVNFKSGKRESFDLVVACDGANSTTRAIGLGGTTRTNTEPIGSWAAYFTMKCNIVDTPKLSEGLSLPGGRLIAVGPDTEPNQNRAICLKSAGKNDKTELDDFRKAQSTGDKTLRDHVFKTFDGVGWKSPTVLREMYNSDEFYASETIMVKLPKYFKNRFVLVGDAGYSTGGNGAGTSMALTGAYILAGEIAAHSNNLAVALEAYDKAMRPLVAKNQSNSSFAKSIFVPQTSWGLALRNNIFMIMYKTKLLDAITKLGGTVGAKAAKVKDYEFPN